MQVLTDRLMWCLDRVWRSASVKDYLCTRNRRAKILSVDMLYPRIVVLLPEIAFLLGIDRQAEAAMKSNW